MRKVLRIIRYSFFMLNRAFYKGRLPRPSFVYRQTKDENLYAEAHCSLDGYAIVFTPLFLETLELKGPLFLCEVMLHEMAHIAVYASKRYESDEHGDLFKRMCELHGLCPIWCGEEMKWAITEVKNSDALVFSDISKVFHSLFKDLNLSSIN